MREVRGYGVDVAVAINLLKFYASRQGPDYWPFVCRQRSIQDRGIKASPLRQLCRTDSWNQGSLRFA